jgi:hypothetical protein
VRRRWFRRASGDADRGSTSVGGVGPPGNGAGRDWPALAGLEAAVLREDPRFAEGLRVGHPVAPWEYRQQATRLVVTVLAGAQVVMLVIGWDVVAVVVGIVLLGWSARQR